MVRWSVSTVVVATVLFVGLGAAPAQAAPVNAAMPVSIGMASAVETEFGKDSDTDTIPDEVEREVCGTAACATGLEDTDSDGIPDWSEVLAVGDTTSASARKDSDGDGIPNWAERLVCGTDTCSNSTEDADSDRIGDWVEFVICGSRACADGTEDYDANGIADAVELAACVKRVDDLAWTGFAWMWLGVLALCLIVAGGTALVVRQMRRRQLSTGDSDTDESGEGE